MRQPQLDPSVLPKSRAMQVDGYVQRNLWIALATLVGFALFMAVIALVFERQLVAVTEWIAARIGVAGLLGIVFVGDAVLSPIAPDLVVLVVAHSSLAEHGWTLSLLLGCVSWIAGCLGWYFGSKLQSTPIPKWLFGRGQAENRALFQRYGRWAVGLGAMTPVPFSLTCWSAGMLGLSLRDVVVCGMLRIPRILLSYGCIAYADDLLALIF